MHDPAIIPIFAFLSVGSFALFGFISVATWADSRRKEREAFYRSEVLKKLAESTGPGAQATLDYLRETERNGVLRRREGMKIGGVVNIAVGVALTGVLASAFHGNPAQLLGLIPLLVGLAMLLYVYVLAPKI